jgi:hypothetical protein
MSPKRGNPNWTSGRGAKVRPAGPTEFDIQAKHLGLTKQNYVGSAELRNWCERNSRRFYVPEWLLQEWKIPIDPSFT